MSDKIDLLVAIYETRREQVLLHLKGRDDALKTYLIVAAALGAASQAQAIGPVALMAVPLVALGLAISFSFHHLYVGVIVCFLRSEFKKETNACGIVFPEWDRSSSHGGSVWVLRILTLAAPALVFSLSSLACYLFGVSTPQGAAVLRDAWWICPYGWGFSLGAGILIVLTGLYRRHIEKYSPKAPNVDANSAENNIKNNDTRKEDA